MYLSRIKIENFRNFSELDVRLAGNLVVLGENRVGKSNLIYGLQLIFDPTLSDAARQLTRDDFWDGLEELDEDDKIVVSVEIKDFEEDIDVLAVLTDFRLDDDPSTIRLTYEFRPKAEIEHLPASDEDYEFLCYGGESEIKRFGHDLRRRIPIDLLPALRDAESDLATWRRSPLRPLIENAFHDVDHDELDSIKTAIEEATAQLGEFEAVQALEDSFAKLFADMSGPKHDINPMLGFAPTDVTRLYRNIRLLIDGGRRGITEASLGSANIVFLTLKTLEVQRQIEENQRDHTLFCIEEPEAHLHPHLQRSIYRHLFESLSDEEKSPLSILLTTHSPHIASVAPLRSILLLKETSDEGTTGHSTAGIEMTTSDEEDLSRYLDVTRAEMLFARGVILVEGDAEKFLFPAFSEAIGHSLDKIGITICSVSGTNFRPYVNFLSSISIPFAVVTDWDPRGDDRTPLGKNRVLNLIRAVEENRTQASADELIEELEEVAEENLDEFKERCNEFGIFTNEHTLEVDLFLDDDFTDHIANTLREQNFSEATNERIDDWEADPESLNTNQYLKLIDRVGKGRFAQRLTTRIEGEPPPNYISAAIEFVVDLV